MSTFGGWIEHFGINVPDVAAAKAYYDELMPLVGYMPYFGTGYVPTNWKGVQLFLYPALQGGDDYHRERAGLSHIAFMVPTRADVERLHEWAVGKGNTILHAPRPFPEYGEHTYAMHFLDMHGFHLEITCFARPEGDSEGKAD